MSSANNSKLTVSALDFDSIKSNLLDYLKSQSEFADYNFDGSALNQLVNLLAYNTHYLSFYLNMVANEMFIDTAVLKQNIISHAKLLGYTPRSSTAAQAVVNVAITKLNTDSTTILTLPRFTPFASEPLNGVAYNFVTVDETTVSNSNAVFTFFGVVLKEGQPVTKTFSVDSAVNTTQTFDLGDEKIDISTLQVVVQASQTNLSQNTFSVAEDATAVESNSNVFYLDVGQSGNYRIYFGDDILGKKLNDGNLVIVSYLITTGEEANGLQRFRLQSALLSGSSSNTTTAIASSAGSAAESAESIRFSAPKSYLAQNRTVTVNDYINIINKKYPYFQAVNVWGGQDNVPPVYGKVFISAKPKAGFAITAAQKQYVIEQILQPVGVLTVIPEFVDTDYNFLNFRFNVHYDPKKTSGTANQILGIVTTAAATWANNFLNKFNTSFKLSRLLRAIDDADSSIISSSCDVYIEKRFDPIIDVSTTYILNYGTPLRVGVGVNKLYSTPTFIAQDTTGVNRDCFIEETPQSSTGVSSVTVVGGGSGYQTTPTLSLVGDGSGANAYAVIVNGEIDHVVVDAEGIDYTTATVLISGGSGSGAVLQALVEGSTGTLRSYYFDQNNVKTVLNHSAGIIDYENGVVTLNDFNPSDVTNFSQTLSIHVQPASDSFGSNLNRIITYDTTDPGAVSVTIQVDSED